jgi:hypothetical protein
LYGKSCNGHAPLFIGLKSLRKYRNIRYFNWHKYRTILYLYIYSLERKSKEEKNGRRNVNPARGEPERHNLESGV